MQCLSPANYRLYRLTTDWYVDNIGLYYVKWRFTLYYYMHARKICFRRNNWETLKYLILKLRRYRGRLCVCVGLTGAMDPHNELLLLPHLCSSSYNTVYMSVLTINVCCQLLEASISRMCSIHSLYGIGRHTTGIIYITLFSRHYLRLRE